MGSQPEVEQLMASNETEGPGLTDGGEPNDKGGIRELQEERESSGAEEEGSKLSLDFTKLLEDKSLLSKKSFDAGNYTRGCKWSPDGLCILVCNRDHHVRIFEPQTDPEKWDEAVSVRECGTIYDFQWYPLMSSSDPDSCVFACTSQSQPIHLFDAFNGEIRASYRIYDDVDEVVSARSLCFSPLGDKLYAGRRNEIKVFDVNVPGRHCETHQTYGKKDGGLGGIISCVAVNPAVPKIYAAGSYSKGVAVFLEPGPQTLCYLDGQKGGVTHVQFTPDGSKLCAGGRKDDEILIWDLRNPGQLYAVVDRTVKTNQRIYFDVDASGRFLASGSTDGSLRIWDLNSIDEEGGEVVLPHNLKTVLQNRDFHKDCINGISFHPHLPCIATCTGQRRVDTLIDSSSEEEAESQEESQKVDNSLCIWTLK